MQPTPWTSSQIIHLHLHAPRQPAFGDRCNGCGVCCASEPCPLGMVISRRTHGRCSALVWHAPQQRYRCTLALLPGSAVPARWRWAARLKARLAQHFISAGAGCDSRATSHPL